MKQLSSVSSLANPSESLINRIRKGVNDVSALIIQLFSNQLKTHVHENKVVTHEANVVINDNDLKLLPGVRVCFKVPGRTRLLQQIEGLRHWPQTNPHLSAYSAEGVLGRPYVLLLRTPPPYLSHSLKSPVHFAKWEPHVLYGSCVIQVNGFFRGWATSPPSGLVANSPPPPSYSAFTHSSFRPPSNVIRNCSSLIFC